MASGFVTEFNIPEIEEDKRIIPEVLLDFKKNRERTKAKLKEKEKEKENLNEFNKFEKVMARKNISDIYGGKIKEAPVVGNLIGTENSNFTLNTENNFQIITEQ